MKKITFLLNLLFFLLPLTFLPVTSELFEFNKMVLVYLVTVLVSASWIFECVRKRRFIFRNTGLTIPLFIFLLSQVLASLFSIDTRTSLLGYYGRFHGGLLSTVCYTILYFAFTTFVERTQAIRAVKTLLISAAIAAVYAGAEHFGVSPSCLLISGKPDTACWVQDVGARVFGTFGQPNWLAAFLVAVIPLAWALMGNFDRSLTKTLSPRQKGIQNTITYLAFFALMFLALLFTKSRSGLLGFLFAFFIFWPAAFYLGRNRVRKIMPLFAFVAAYAILTLAFVWNPFTPSQEPPVDGVTESGDIRKIVWQGAVALWKKYPVFGTGVETFAYSYYETRPVAHNETSEWNYLYNKAHNEYLNFAATTGTVGLASYLLLIFASIKMLIKKLNLLKIALLAGYVSILVTNFFGFSTVTTAVLFFLFPAVAAAASSVKYQAPSVKLNFSSSFQKTLQVFILIVVVYLEVSLGGYWLADYYYAKGDVLSLERAVLLSPGEAVYRAKLGAEYAGISRQLAEKELEISAGLSPRNVKLLKDIALTYDDMGRAELSLALYQELVLHAPTDVQVWYQLALTQTKLGKIADARKALEQALVMKPDYETAKKLYDYIK